MVAPPGSPLSAMNNPRTLEPVANRTDWNDTFNFELPASWTSGTVELWGSASNGTTFEIVEGPVTVTFTENDPLNMTVVPFAYTCTTGGYGTVTPASPYDYLIDHTYKIYQVPSVQMTTHAPLAYSGPCYNGTPNLEYDNWLDILYGVTSVWYSDGSLNNYYYAVVDIYCDGSCIVGLGWVGGIKAAAGFTGFGSLHSGASTTHTHEVGHNHGRAHEPGCGAGNPDVNYTYSNGYIGDVVSPNYGFDLFNMTVKPHTNYYNVMT